jgi:hypothetical protein
MQLDRCAQGCGGLAGRRPVHPAVLASQLMADEPYQQGHPPARLYAGRRPGQRKGNAMNTRSPYPDAEVPEISPPRFVLDRSDERGPAVPLMGPADHGSASPLMGPAAAGTVTPLMGPADPATVTPLLGPADPGTTVSPMGPADPGTATPLMRPSRYASRRPQDGPLVPPGRRPAGRPGRTEHAPAIDTASL